MTSQETCNTCNDYKFKDHECKMTYHYGVKFGDSLISECGYDPDEFNTIRRSLLEVNCKTCLGFFEKRAIEKGV